MVLLLPEVPLPEDMLPLDPESPLVPIGLLVSPLPELPDMPPPLEVPLPLDMLPPLELSLLLDEPEPIVPLELLLPEESDGGEVLDEPDDPDVPEEPDIPEEPDELSEDGAVLDEPEGPDMPLLPIVPPVADEPLLPCAEPDPLLEVCAIDCPAMPINEMRTAKVSFFMLPPDAEKLACVTSTSARRQR